MANSSRVLISLALLLALAAASVTAQSILWGLPARMSTYSDETGGKDEDGTKLYKFCAPMPKKIKSDAADQFSVTLVAQAKDTRKIFLSWIPTDGSKKRLTPKVRIKCSLFQLRAKKKTPLEARSATF